MRLPHAFAAAALAAALAAATAAAQSGPTVTFTTKPPHPTTNPDASFAWTTSAGATTTCQLDKEAAAPCKDSFERKGLALGVHTFAVNATSSDGGSASLSWAWEITKPVAPKDRKAATAVAAKELAALVSQTPLKTLAKGKLKIKFSGLGFAGKLRLEVRLKTKKGKQVLEGFATLNGDGDGSATLKFYKRNGRLLKAAKAKTKVFAGAYWVKEKTGSQASTTLGKVEIG
jgi:hypothetical protein